MDDITLSGPIEIVATDVTSIRDKGISFGVHINTGKCESITKTASVSVAPLTDFVQLKKKKLCIIGGSFSVGSAIGAFLLNRFSELKQAADRFSLIPANDSLIL